MPNPAPKSNPASTVDAADVARFTRLGNEWWNLTGSMAPLHKLNPVRIAFIRDCILSHCPNADGTARDARRLKSLAGLSILDIGCGGGILSEPLSRLGASVTGIDPGADNIGVARTHAEHAGLEIDYRATTAEELAATGARFDVVMAMEVVEHVTDVQAFVATACEMVQPGGLFFAATLNRTLKSFALAIVGAEYVLRWVPKGTHRWEQFVTPAELTDAIEMAGLDVTDRTGVVFNPLSNNWRTSRDMDVNYMLAAEKRVVMAL
jgi:2-polyprenyl-6-hydroxyphenyl methylase/3-demethylubiquinone-9 3-methyltransferase